MIKDVQLAIRSGQYLDIDVFTIKDGEYKGRDKNTGRPIFEFIEDDEVAETKEVIGYMATFTLLNGFNKQLYWSKEKATKHAKGNTLNHLVMVVRPTYGLTLLI